MSQPNQPQSESFNEPQGVSLTSASLAMLTAALWGGTAVAISFSVDTLPPVAVAAIRFTIGAVFMIVWSRFEKSELRLRPGQFRPAILAGVLLFVQISLFNIGIWQSNSSHASMLINTYVFWVVGIEHFFTKTDRLTSRKSIGFIIAGAGAALVLWTSQSASAPEISLAAETSGRINFDIATLSGDLILLLSGLVLGFKIIVIKQSLKVMEPSKIVFWHSVVGVVLFAAYSLLMEETKLSDFTLPAVLGLAYQGVFVAGVCFAIQALLMRKHSASQISVFSFAMPLFGVLLAVLFRGDALSIWLLVATAFVATGIYLVNSKSKKSKSHSQLK